MEAQIGKTYLKKIPHNGSEITFQHPAFRGTYGDVAKQIDSEKLERPNSAETASLVCDAWRNPSGEYEKQIIQILNDAWLWEFAGNLYLPKSRDEINNGVILEDNPRIVNGELNMNKQSLVKKLRKNDSSVKFVPFGYKTGEQTPIELGKNPYILARYGEEGAQKIAEIASKYKSKPKLWSFNSVDEEKLRMSALDRYWNLGCRLNVNGDCWNDNISGYAFGRINEDK